MAAFTTIATAASLAITAGGATNSFIQAGKQRDRQEEAERKTKEALEKADEKLQVNFFEGRSIQKEPFERARENLLSGGAQALQVAQAGERGASAAANRVVTAQQAGEADIRTAMSREMADIQLMALKEESRLRDARANLNLAEAQGQQMIAADARAAEQAANQAGVDGLISMGQQAMKIPGLYGSSGTATTDVNGAQVSNDLIKSSPSRFYKDESGKMIDRSLLDDSLGTNFAVDNSVFGNPFQSVSTPVFNSIPLDQQYDSVTGRLIQ